MTPEERIKDIIQGVIHLDDAYVLDAKYIRWGRVEKELLKTISEAEQASASFTRKQVVEECVELIKCRFKNSLRHTELDCPMCQAERKIRSLDAKIREMEDK